MDVFLVKLSLIISHIATAMFPLIMNNLTQKYIHSGLTFVIKRPLYQRTKVVIFSLNIPSLEIFSVSLHCYQ